jgi:membrane fusion protein, multidrug efflux system
MHTSHRPAMKHHLSVPLALTAAALLGAACGGSTGASSASGAKGNDGSIKKREAARVHVEPVLRREMVRVLETTTRVESEHQVEIVPRATGVVTELLVEEGDHVREGQVLARLDSRDAKIAVRDAEVAVEEARANLPKLELATQEGESRAASAKRSYEQSDRDYQRNIAIAQGGPDKPALLSAKDLDQSRLARDNALSEYQNAQLVGQRNKLEEQAGKNALERAQLNLDRARLNLSHLELTAPFAGVLASRSIKVGDTASAATPAFVLTDPDSLRAVFYRPQRELALFGAGTPADGGGENASHPGAELEIQITAEALPERAFRGSIERIAPTIDPQSGNFRVTARLEPQALPNRESQGRPAAWSNARLLPGMLVRISIVTERRAQALVVHKRAVRREGDTHLVFAVREGRAVRIPVVEGLSDDEYVEVAPLGAGTLAEGESVVVVGNRDLEDGAEVTPEAATPGSAGAVESSEPSGVAEALRAQEGQKAAGAENESAPTPTENAAAPGNETGDSADPPPAAKPAQPPAGG